VVPAEAGFADDPANGAADGAARRRPVPMAAILGAAGKTALLDS